MFAGSDRSGEADALRQYVEMIDDERAAFGASYPGHGKLMVLRTPASCIRTQ